MNSGRSVNLRTATESRRGLLNLHQSELELILDRAFSGHGDNVRTIVALQSTSKQLKEALSFYRVHVVLGFSTRLPSDAAFSRLCKSLPEMLSLTVDDGPESASLPLSRSQLSCLEICTHLTRLDLRGAEISFRQGEILEGASLPSSLVELSLPPVPIRSYFREGLRLALTNIRLKKLVCHGTDFYPGTTLTSLQELHVDCNGGRYSSNFLKDYLQRLTNLTHLSLSGPGSRGVGAKVAKTAKSAVVAPASILSLQITGFISPHSLETLLNGLRGLQTLSLFCASDKNTVLPLNRVSSSLRSLELYNSHSDISKLRTPQLQDLICIMSLPELSDKDINIIASHSQLTSLHLERVAKYGDTKPLGTLPLRELTLSNNCEMCFGLLTQDSLQHLESFRMHTDYEPFDSEFSKYVREHIFNLPKLIHFDTNFIY